MQRKVLGREGKKAESQTPGRVPPRQVDPGRTSNYRPSPASEGKWGSFLHTACCTETLSFNETNAKYFCERRSVVSDSLQPHGLYSAWNSQARTLEWGAFPFSRGSSQPGIEARSRILHQLINKGSSATRGTTTVPRHCPKTNEWAVAYFLEISTPSPKLLE